MAAGIILVREAGGFVRDIDNQKKNPALTGAIMAANDPIMAQMGKQLRGA